MRRPSFQFYPADWRNNAKLRRCSESARGAWMDVLCVLHDSDEYGICRWPLEDLARASGVSLKLINELAHKDVLKGADYDAKPYVHTPMHAGKFGIPITLVEHKGGPVWYCSRFVRDEWIRLRRGAGTRFDSDNQPNTIPSELLSPTGSPTRRVGYEFGDLTGGRQGDGPSSSSSSSSSNKKKTATAVRLSDAEFLEQLKQNPAFAGIDVSREHLKMIAWCTANGKMPSQRRFVNWINRAERPMKTQPTLGSTIDGNANNHKGNNL